MVKEYWHVTRIGNVPSIRAKGLIPQIGANSESCQEEAPRVYLFTSKDAMETALAGWLGELYEDVDEFALLRVSLPEQFASLCTTTEGFECEATCTKTIPAEYIEFFDEEYKLLEE